MNRLGELSLHNVTGIDLVPTRKQDTPHKSFVRYIVIHLDNEERLEISLYACDEECLQVEVKL